MPDTIVTDYFYDGEAQQFIEVVRHCQKYLSIEIFLAEKWYINGRILVRYRLL